MMKCCCLIVSIFCTLDVSNGGILSGICHSSNGTCGTKGVPCNETFGSEWAYTGKCCNNRPCCKSLKPPCVPETICPRGFRLLQNQSSSANCYLYGANTVPWEDAQSICSGTPGAYLWRPNTLQEANAVYHEFFKPDANSIWTGANDRDTDGNFTFITENSPLQFNDLPFGSDAFDPSPDAVYVVFFFDLTFDEWRWGTMNSLGRFRYICEYRRIILHHMEVPC